MAEKKNEVAVQQTATVQYEANGESVKLSPAMIKKYLVNGGGNVTDQEVIMFMNLCRYQHLNPFLKEAYLIKFGSQTATMVTGKDVFTKRAEANPNYKGKQAGVIVLTEKGEIIEREGSFVLKSEQLVGGWAKVFINGRETPEYASVSFEEYVGRKSSGEINGQWKSKPATMIRKVAVVQALREAFPDVFQGLYAQEEMAQVQDVYSEVKEDIDKNANSVNFEEVSEPEVVVEQTEEQPQTEQAEPDWMG